MVWGHLPSNASFQAGLRPSLMRLIAYWRGIMDSRMRKWILLLITIFSIALGRDSREVDRYCPTICFSLEVYFQLAIFFYLLISCSAFGAIAHDDTHYAFMTLLPYTRTRDP